jgi:hypothetical protein
MEEQIPHPSADDIALQAQPIGLFADQMKHRILYFRVRYTHILQNRVQNYKKKMKKARKIWSIQKNVVPLRRFSRKSMSLFINQGEEFA